MTAADDFLFSHHSVSYALCFSSYNQVIWWVSFLCLIIPSVNVILGVKRKERRQGTISRNSDFCDIREILINRILGQCASKLENVCLPWGGRFLPSLQSCLFVPLPFSSYVKPRTLWEIWRLARWRSKLWLQMPMWNLPLYSFLDNLQIMTIVINP